ncbi:MAG: hypothetical protein NTX30_21415 [Deltaproteobacteria bacterium]|nr:hypothetical protein [Deltaproteobacteria bacterium]
MPLDDITRKRLLVAKRVFDHAAIQSMGPALPFRGILAVIAFDWSIEAAIRAGCLFFDPSHLPPNEFHPLLDRCEKHLLDTRKQGLPNRAHIVHVHNIRNEVQHKGRYPNASEVQDCRTYTRDFLADLFRLVWQISIDDLRSSDIIRNARAKGFIRDAEVAHKGGELKKAIECAIAALRWALLEIGDSVIGSFPGFAKGLAVLDSRNKVNEDYSRNALRVFTRMRDVLLSYILGLDMADFAKCSALAPSVVFAIDGTPNFFYFQDFNTTTDQVEWVVAFCTASIISIEDRVGDLDKPFGISP